MIGLKSIDQGVLVGRQTKKDRANRFYDRLQLFVKGRCQRATFTFVGKEYQASQGRSMRLG